MTTKIIEARSKALTALIMYAEALKEKDYNERCIRDSIVVTALDAFEMFK